MKNKKIILGVSSLLLVASLITTGCGKEVKISSKAAVGFESGEITANEFYKEIKEDNVSKLLDLIDHKLLDEKYPETDDENKEIKKQIDQLKNYYANETQFKNLLKQYYGVETEKELESILRLEYKRQQAVEDYIEEHLGKDEINKYYNEKIYGNMSAKHILIKVDVNDDATDEEKQEAEDKALETAKKVIKKLDDGKSFDSLAKKYSDDKSNANNGGNLGNFEYTDMVEEFSKACADLKVDEYTKEPVKTAYGYHVILKTKQDKKPALKKVKKDIKEKLREQKLNDDPTLYYNTLMAFREDNGLTWNDSKLKKAYNKLMDDIIDQVKEKNQ